MEEEQDSQYERDQVRNEQEKRKQVLIIFKYLGRMTCMVPASPNVIGTIRREIFMMGQSAPSRSRLVRRSNQTLAREQLAS